MSSVNMYLKLKLAKGGQIKGAASGDGHIEEILLDSFSWGEENTGLIGGKSEKPTLRNFEFTKKMCPASVPMMLACASNDLVQEAIISLRSSNATEKVDFLRWTLADGAICHYEVEATAKESIVPGERVRIRFNSLTVEFKPRNAEGKLGATMSARVDSGANTASA